MDGSVIFFPIPKDELIDLIGKVIDQRLEKYMGKGNPTKDTDELMTIDECSKFLKISKQTLYGYSSRNEIPCMKKARRLMFSKSELIEWVKTGRKKTITEILNEVEDLTSKH